VIALSIIFVALLGLVYTATVGFSDIALSRQRQVANQIGAVVADLRIAVDLGNTTAKARYAP
jgi:hypothetical protein